MRRARGVQALDVWEGQMSTMKVRFVASAMSHTWVPDGIVRSTGSLVGLPIAIILLKQGNFIPEEGPWGYV